MMRDRRRLYSGVEMLAIIMNGHAPFVVVIGDVELVSGLAPCATSTRRHTSFARRMPENCQRSFG